MKQFKIIVDGSNGAFTRRNYDKKAKFKNLKIIMEYLDKLKEKYSIDYEIITDANLKFCIDEKSELEKLYKTGLIIQCPSKMKADDFIIEYFKRYPENTIILSNDNFTEYSDINLIVCKFVFIFDEVIIQPDITEFFDISNNFNEENKADVQAI